MLIETDKTGKQSQQKANEDKHELGYVLI